MDKTIKELTLLMIYLTSWQEDTDLTKVQRSWKGYSFGALDELNEEGYIDGSKYAKSVYLRRKNKCATSNINSSYMKSDITRTDSIRHIRHDCFSIFI